MSSNQKTIHATLDHFLSVKFDRVKEYLGIQNDAEVIRVLITEIYRQKFIKEIDNAQNDMKKALPFIESFMEKYGKEWNKLGE
ncbi:MAG: hypothetical protein ACTSWL_01820 [Promethearchaeota archaeon]